MNTLNSTIEPVQNASTLMDDEYSCSAIDKSTGEFCGETESLRIIEEFQKLYQTRIENVDQEFEIEHDRTSMKLKIMRDWVKDLMEQNITLVQIVEDLEQTACSRVKLLEQKLRQSSLMVSENMTNSNLTEKTINTFSNRIDDLVKNEKYMQQKITFLQSDIKGLLELIRRAAQENHWSLDGIKFFEIKPNNIPIPLSCTCDQEETNHKKIQSLELENERLHKNEAKMIQYQQELEHKLGDFNTKLQAKENTIKRYVSHFQNFTNNLKNYGKCGDQINFSSFTQNDEETADIMLMTVIVENILTQKNTEIKELKERLDDTSSHLEVVHSTHTDLDNMKIQLKEKYRKIEEIQQQMSDLQKESLEKQDTLSVKIMKKNELITSLQNQITALQEKYSYATIQVQFKQDIIKKMRKELKQAIAKRTPNVCIENNACREDSGTLRYPINQEIISQLAKVKSFMEQEYSDVEKLKSELQKTLEQSYYGKDEGCCKNKDEFNMNNVRHNIERNINCLNQMCSKKEESIKILNSILRMESNQAYMETENLLLTRHQKYIDLNEEVTNAQNQLIKSQKKITETLERLQLQEEERNRHNERINLKKIKLKDIKNEINLSRSRLSIGIVKIQNNIGESVVSNYTDIGMCNDLLCSAIEEIDHTSSSLQLFGDQISYMTSDLEELKCQLCNVNLSLKQVQQKMDEALMEHDTVETTLLQKEQKLEKLENEVDLIHTKIQNTLETFITSSNAPEHQLYTQTLNEILRAKQDLCKLRKEHDELKQTISQKTLNTKCNENACSWKHKVTDLQSQVKLLQHEIKCKQEANDFLKDNIEFMKRELRDAQEKADYHRRSHSVDCMEFKKRIIELENTLKLQRETECTLRQQLSDEEVELKKSKELLNSLYTDYNIGETLRCGCKEFAHDAMTVPQLFKTLESTVQFTKCGLQEFRMELNNLICEDTANVPSPGRLVPDLADKFKKYEDELDKCSQEIENLKTALYSKDKLLANKEEIIRIQKNSIEMAQTELKQLHENLQEKIDLQEQMISQFEKEKKELIKENELQIQTIGHLQNAVVEAKRCIDQMGHRTMSDLQERNETIRLLSVYVEETQSQYNDCFSEAAKQDKLLELQRNVIYDLQKKIQHMECDNNLIISSIHVVYYSLLKTIQEQMRDRVTDFPALKYTADTLVQSKCCLEDKYLKKICQEAEEKLQELRKMVIKQEKQIKIQKDKACQCNKEVSYEHDLESEIDILSRENEDIKRQLQKYKLDFDIIDKELKIERENGTYAQQILLELKDSEYCLRTENEKLKSDYKKLKVSEATQIQQAETIKELEKKLNISNQKTTGYLSELNDVEEIIPSLHKRIETLKIMLNNKSDELAKLQANYEVLKNDHSILKAENYALEAKAKGVCQMKAVQMQLSYVENNYEKVTQDFHKAQERLILMTEREADLQKSLTKMEKEYYSKVSSLEKENAKLSDRLDKLMDELEEIQINYSSKNNEHCKLQDICKSYADQLHIMQQTIEEEREKVQKLEESNHCAMQRLQKCMEQNCTLNQEKALLEHNNCEIISKLQETHKSLLELKKECQLKNKSLACISAELTETAMSRSELCSQSEYIVSCIRVWMKEQQEFVNKLNLKLKYQQEQLLHLGIQKKTFLDEIKKLKRINHLLTQRLKRMYRHNGKNIKNVCVGCHMALWNTNYSPEPHITVNAKHLLSQKKSSLIKASRRVATCGNASYFPKMKYLINELRKSNVEYNENFSNRGNNDTALEESRDYGYQSSTSK